MRSLGQLQHRKGNKLIFKSNDQNIPPIGGVVKKKDLIHKSTRQDSNKSNRIGKIIDIIGPIKQPLIIIKLDREEIGDLSTQDIFWEKSINKKYRRRKNKGFGKDKLKTKKFR